MVVKSAHVIGQFIDRLNRHRLFVNESAEQSPCVVGNRRLRFHTGGGLRDVIDTLDVVGHADAAVVAGVFTVGLDDLNWMAELLPLDIHALIPPKILIAKFAGIFVVMQN